MQHPNKNLRREMRSFYLKMHPNAFVDRDLLRPAGRDKLGQEI